MEPGAVLFIVVVWFLLKRAAVKKQTKRHNTSSIHAYLASHPAFNASKIYVAPSGQSGLTIDEESNELGLITQQDSQVSLRIYQSADILSAEIVKDGKQVTHSDRSSQLTGAAVGAILAGKSGGIVGGLSGKKTKTQIATQLSLHITLNDTARPQVWVSFLTSNEETGSYTYKEALHQAQYWHDLIRIMMKRAQQPERTTEPQKTIRSVANDLQTLADLKASGALTETEFQAAKSRLLES